MNIIKKNNIFSKIKITSSLLVFIFIYALLTISSTYAYLSLNANNNTASGTASCGNISYNGTNITGANLETSTSYLDGIHSTITMSKNINGGYTEADIYIHNNQGSNIPLNNGVTGYEAFKYVILQGTTIVSSGIIQKSNTDQLLATVELTTTATTYDVYVWIDSELSNGLYNNVSYTGYIYAKAICSSTVGEPEESNNFVYTVNIGTYILHGNSIPNTITIYNNPTSAMAAFDNRQFYFKHVLENDIVTESYLEFVITPEAASGVQGMTAGTYALRGGVVESESGSKPVYNANINTLKQAYGQGSEECSDFTNTTEVNCHYPFGILVNSSGVVAAYDWSSGTDSVYCAVDNDGDSRCTQ